MEMGLKKLIIFNDDLRYSLFYSYKKNNTKVAKKFPAL